MPSSPQSTCVADADINGFCEDYVEVTTTISCTNGDSWISGTAPGSALCANATDPSCDWPQFFCERGQSADSSR